MSFSGLFNTRAFSTKENAQSEIEEYDESEYSESDFDEQKKQISIGELSPHFYCKGIKNGKIADISSDDFIGKNFSFVCPTEILEFSEMSKKFKDLDCDVVGASVDSQYSHLAWMKTPRSEGGLGKTLSIPLIADLGGNVAESFDAMNPQGFSNRNTYIIDPNGIVRHISMNDPKIGRNVNEVYRLVQAIKKSDETGKVMPVNWNQGEDTIEPDVEGIKEYLKKKK